MLEILSDILTNMTMRGTMYFRTSFTKPWGVSVPGIENGAWFHFARRGACLVRIEGVDEPVDLAQGDLILIPRGASHDLYCGQDPANTILPFDQVLEKPDFDGTGVLINGDESQQSEALLICGQFSFELHARHSLMERLPPFIRLKNYGDSAGNWLEATLQILSKETDRRWLDDELIALKTSEIIFVQAIRGLIEEKSPDGRSLGALSDRHLCRALDEFHKAPAYPWTLKSLANVAGMSRTGFAALFRKKMTMTPMRYISECRMEIARIVLRQPDATLSVIAKNTGYASDSAFLRAFKKEMGMTPTEFRRTVAGFHL